MVLKSFFIHNYLKSHRVKNWCVLDRLLKIVGGCGCVCVCYLYISDILVRKLHFWHLLSVKNTTHNSQEHVHCSGIKPRVMFLATMPDNLVVLEINFYM